MPASVSQELADLARLAREGGLDLSPISLRVKTDLLLSTPHPSPDDLAAFGEMAGALLPGIDEATAMILARKLAGWPHTPPSVLAGLAAKGGAVPAELIRHGMPLSEAALERLVETGDEPTRAALSMRGDLTARTVLMLVSGADREVDLLLIANRDAPLPRAAVESLIARARIDPAYRPGLLARDDLSNIERAPLFLEAGAQRRLAIIESLMAREALHASERRPALTGPVFAGWLDLAASDRDDAFAAIAEHLGGGATLADAMARDASRELAALALTASGASVEEATRFLIRLGDETAHSVERIFALVSLMRTVKPAIALRLTMQIAGTSASAPQRRGQHQPAMDPSGTPSRAGAARPETQPAMSEILGKLGARR
ncbi:DUF2336 domain-containing protein [Bosea sp. (in: a-proteobacteria)]|uniref:DUF2336 domain-containing protein n=1 Tax=Bosea sp. (in: a-proteobacteria) TaxID=1871050 RepID=UPI0026113B7D|nr:DUF2336 domain-containing protein [Bosea sp. (in: a-proteobacteria)]MCO5092425.1 DUF2336 domain-containing protein [Bosea sp. (in: a-proteobacteria)]